MTHVLFMSCELLHSSCCHCNKSSLRVKPTAKRFLHSLGGAAPTWRICMCVGRRTGITQCYSALHACRRSIPIVTEYRFRDAEVRWNGL